MQAGTQYWDKLRRELDAWDQLNTTATLWWRDDDAEQPVEALERLFHLSESHAAPVAIAVSPALATPALGTRIREHSECAVLQHGYAHSNHASPERKKNELGDDRPIQTVTAELRNGFRRMQQLFGDRFVTVMVPPWNRISDTLTAGLYDIGFTGISTYLARNTMLEHNLIRCNTHVDIVDWKAGDRFVGTDRAIQLLVEHLAARRAGEVDPNEPTGLLTHHLRHDENAWQFIEKLLDYTTRHPIVRWRSAAEIFNQELRGHNT